MTQVPYQIISNGDTATVTAFYPEVGPKVANNDHPAYADIKAGLEAGDDVLDLFDASVAAARYFKKVSDRVSVSNGHVYFDGDEIDSTLSRQIVRLLDEGTEDWNPLVLFMEKVQQNPTEHSRSQLFDWLRDRDFTITPDGDFVAYKGVTSDAQGNLVSCHTGPGIVNGEAVNGHVPNPIGGIIEIARSYVNHDPSQGCSTGLHVGTYAYAKGYARSALLEVHVNPRDVVSVPTDCDAQKVRVSRYKVVKAEAVEYDTAFLPSYDPDDVSDEPDCGGCGDNADVEDGYCTFCGIYI